MFLQEAGSVEWEKTIGHTVISNHTSVIIYRTDVFGEPDEK